MSTQDNTQGFTILSSTAVNFAPLTAQPIATTYGSTAAFTPHSFAVITVPAGTIPTCVHGSGCVFTLLFSSVSLPVVSPSPVDIYFVHCPYGPPCP